MLYEHYAMHYKTVLFLHYLIIHFHWSGEYRRVRHEETKTILFYTTLVATIFMIIFGRSGGIAVGHCKPAD